MKCGNSSSDDLFKEDQIAYWLAFDRLATDSGLGSRKIRFLIARFESAEDAWKADPRTILDLKLLSEEQIGDLMEQRGIINPSALVKEIEAKEVRALPIYHPLYPFRLREIHDPPLVLYTRGQLEPIEANYSIAVVGTRKPTSYGQRLAKEIARGLAENGVNVVSGMAVGIDSLAHWGAIDGGGRTLAVLGCGPDICYPSSNKPLYGAIVNGEHGAVFSEYFPGTKPEGWRFPARNRIISGLCGAVVVIEGSINSGSLITARLAFEQSRDVFAIPGRIDQPMSEGPNELIRKNMAQLVRNAEDILKSLNWVSAPQGKMVPTVVELYGREREVFESVSNEPVHFDYLCEKLGMQAGELSATLTMLELAGVIERLPGDWYSRLSATTTV